MTDPLRALRAPTPAVDPDPAFAATLRARLERALALPQGVVVSDTSTVTTSIQSSPPEPAYRHGDVGYAWLSVSEVDRAVAFYGDVMGWTVTPGSDSQGRQVDGRSPHLGLHGGADRATLNCCYAVADIATALGRVRRAGGQAGEPRTAPYGQIADCTDDQGTVFALYQPPDGVGAGPTPPPAGGPGDLVYVTYEVIDSAKARAFYGDVLGWSFAPGGVSDGWQVEGGMAGMQGGHRQATTLPMWQVEDIAVTVDRVRAAGGSATDPQTRPYGLEAECADDQGARFYLGQL